MAKESKKAALSMEDRLDTALVPNWEQPYKVPANWCWIILGNLVSIKRGASPRPIKAYITDDENGVNWIKIGDSDSGKYITQIKEKITEDGAQKSVFVEKGTLLLSNSMSFGHPYILAVDGCIHDGWLAITPGQAFNKEYLYYALLASEWYFERVAVGTAVRNLNSDRVAATPIPLPPLVEQQRIVDRIETLFAKLDEAKEKAQVVMDGFEDRKAAILHKAFTGELTAEWRRKKGINLDSWIMTTASNLFEYVTSGSRGWAQYYADDGAVFIRMGNLDHGTVELDLSDVQHVVLPDKAEGQRSLLRKGDILISITADVGMIGLVRDATFEGYINQHIALARPVQKESAEFIAWYLVSDQGFSQLREKQRGATKVGLGLDDIRSLSLKMPSKEEQDEILRIIGGLISKSTHAKEAAEQVIDQIDTMKKSILARAFRGELDTNDPTDENAIELLKENLNIEKTPAKRAKAVAVPKELSANLKTELEKKIIKLFYQKDTKELPVKEIMTVSSMTFDVLDCLRSLEQRQLITKLENGNYRLMG